MVKSDFTQKLVNHGFYGDLSILNDKSFIIDNFMDLLKAHSIYRSIISVHKKNKIRVNRTIVSLFLSHKIKTLERNTRIILFTKNISKKKQKKLVRFLRNYRIKISYKHRTAINKYISKVKLGYLDYSHPFRKDFIAWWVDNNYDIYNNSLVQTLFNNIIEFLDNNGYIVYNSNTLTKQNLREHINTAIKEFKHLYDKDKNKDSIHKKQPLIMTISDIINYLRDGINIYITHYNNLVRTPITINNNINKYPYIPNYLNNSDYGYYYSNENRAYGWDYNCSQNWYIDWNDPREILFHINDNVKFNTLKQIYKNNFKIYGCNSILSLKKLVINYTNNYMDYLEVDRLIEDLILCGVCPIHFVDCCHAYYSNLLDYY